MSNSDPPKRLSFDENINSLLEELVLADKWHRPSLLLAVHKSKFGQDRAQAALEQKLKGVGHDVTHIVIDPDHSDVPHLAVAAAASHPTTFFISNLDWGGGADRKDAYRALNIYRELFIDNLLRAVFWLTTNEASTLAHDAPDFWAFRHRVIEFSGQRIPRKVVLPAGVLIWDIPNTVDPFDSLPARIAVREELLAKLPHNPEARSSRVDLLGNLGYLYWAQGDASKSTQQLKVGLDLLSGEPAGAIRSPLLNGFAILAYESGDYPRAAQIYEQALRESPADPSLLMNLSVVYCTLGRNDDAASIARKAIKLAEHTPRVWGALGYVYAAMGKFDDCIEAFSKASQLEPRAASWHAALAVCYDLVERPEEVSTQLGLARKLATPPLAPYLDIYEAALLGGRDRALELARSVLRSNRFSPLDLRRDPNLSLLLDSAQLARLFA